MLFISLFLRIDQNVNIKFLWTIYSENDLPTSVLYEIVRAEDNMKSNTEVFLCKLNSVSLVGILYTYKAQDF